jgi:hypothetical protein
MSGRQVTKKKSRKKRQIFYSPYWLSSDLFDERDHDVLHPILEESPYLTPETIISLDISTEWKVAFLLSLELFTKTQMLDLGFAFAEHVLPVFEQYAPDNKSPRVCLDIMRRYVQGQADGNEVKAAMDAVDATLLVMDQEVGYEHQAAQAAFSILTLSACYEDDESFESNIEEIAEFAQKAGNLPLQDFPDSHAQSETDIAVITALENKREVEWQLERIIALLNSDAPATI